MSSLQTFSRQSLVLIGFIRKYNITLTAYCINTMEFGNFNLFTLLQFRTVFKYYVKSNEYVNFKK